MNYNNLPPPSSFLNLNIPTNMVPSSYNTTDYNNVPFTSVSSPLYNSVLSPTYNSIPSPSTMYIPSSSPVFYHNHPRITSLSPSDNNKIEILENIPENKLPDIGILPSTSKTKDRIEYQDTVNNIITDAKTITTTFRGYPAAMNEQGQLYPFVNPNIHTNYSKTNTTNTSNNTISPIILKDHQIDVARRMAYAYQLYPGFLNSGRLGSGKTYLALWLAQYFGFPIFVVAPTTLHDTWSNVARQANIPVVDIITYESLRGTNKTKVKHNYLNRIDEEYVGAKGKIATQVHFTPTATLLQLLDSGVLFIFDEIQKAKNDTAQFYSVTAITRAIHQRGGLSRYLLLSGSPIDKAEQVFRLMSMMNIIKPELLNDKGERVSVTDIIVKAREVDNEAVEQAINNKKNYDSYNASSDLAFKIFINVYKPRFITGMNLPDNDIIADIRNGFYFISPSFIEQWKEGMNMLKSSLMKNAKGDLTVNISIVTAAMVIVEKSIVYDIALRAKFHLDSDPNAKLIIFLNYLDNINTAAALLQNYNPLILTGEIKVNKRSEIIDNFNNNKHYRVLVANITVGGLGVNLQDLKGGEPRIMYISPSYNIQSVYQATGRIVRTGSKSPSMIRIFYGHPLYGISDDDILSNANTHIINKKGTSNIASLFKIFDTLARKSDVTYTTLDDNSIKNLRMPSNYLYVIEGLDNDGASL